MSKLSSRSHKRRTWKGSLLGAASLGVLGCSSGSDSTDDACVSPQAYFAEKVFFNVIQNKCIACHNPQGAAAQTSMVYRSTAEAGFLDTNFETFKQVAQFERDGKSLVLLKPTKSIDHEGGVVISEGSDEYEALARLVEAIKNPAECGAATGTTFSKIELMGAEKTLRRAALTLAARLPTADEIALVQAEGMAGVDRAVEGFMQEEAFYALLKQTYNDLFLTDQYLGGDGLDLLDDETYDPYWFERVSESDTNAYDQYAVPLDDSLYDYLRRETNRAVAREPLELIAYVVRNNRPFKEIVSADYMVVNPFSARAYKAKGAKFKNDADPREWTKVSLSYDESPHAGVLSSPMFLTRHPTTPTNRNRHRARMVYDWFLGTDILKVAQQPLDPTKITDLNPTLNNAECTVCHSNIDPVAGAFRAFGGEDRRDAEFAPQANYREAKWYEDMRPPGFGKDKVPAEQLGTALNWLGQRVGDDPRFGVSAVMTAYTMLTGQAPLLAPSDPNEPGFTAGVQAYLLQYNVFSEIAQKFEASGQNYRVIIHELVKSPYFRAQNALELTEEEAGRYGDLGAARFIGPELLARKVEAVLGYPWKPRAWESNSLLSAQEYRILYGGIDSDEVTRRITTPNGVMANIAERMANEMACLVVPRDMRLPSAERRLFPFVDATFAPKDDNGFEVPPAVQAIRQNIVHLHERILGEKLSDSDPEVDRTYGIFLASWEEGHQAIMADPESWDKKQLRWQCQVHEDYFTGAPISDPEKTIQDDKFAMRAWMNVVSYLMTDYAFLYE